MLFFIQLVLVSQVALFINLHEESFRCRRVVAAKIESRDFFTKIEKHPDLLTMIYIDVTYRHMYVLLLQIYGHSPIKISQRHITEKNDTGSLQTDLRKWKRDRDDEPCKGSTSPLHSSKNSSKNDQQ